MKKRFDIEFMEASCGCYSREHLHACSFMKKKVITLKSILESEIPLKDKYWFVCNKLLTIRQNQIVAIGVATIVLHIYEKDYPGDDRPRKAIEAAQNYLDNPSEDAAVIAANAANAASAAANAAAIAAIDAASAAAIDAASAAIVAANAAIAAANAAAYAAASAAAYAASAANAAAYAAANAKPSLELVLLNFLINFCKSNR